MKIQTIIGTKSAARSQRNLTCTGEATEERLATIFVVEDDAAIGEWIGAVLGHEGYSVELFPDAEGFLSAFHPCSKGCLLVDNLLPGMSGLELIKQFKHENPDLPCVMMTAHVNIAIAVDAMKAGAVDFIEKPLQPYALVGCVKSALAHSDASATKSKSRRDAMARLAMLTPRERSVMDLVVQGLPNKLIASLLNVSQRTVESHRAAVMKRTDSKSIPELVRLVMRATEP